MHKALGIKSIEMTAYHPQTDGMVERFNQTMKTMLDRSMSAFGGQWDQALPFVLGEYHSSPSRATGFTPAELLLGRNVRMPLKSLRKQWMEELLPVRPLTRYLIDLINGMEAMREEARETKGKYKAQMKEYHDRKVNRKTLKTGDLVLVRKHNLLNSYKQMLEGPYPITGVYDNNTVEVALSNNRKDKQRMHLNRLEKYMTPMAECLWLEEDEEW